MSKLKLFFYSLCLLFAGIGFVANQLYGIGLVLLALAAGGLWWWYTKVARDFRSAKHSKRLRQARQQMIMTAPPPTSTRTNNYPTLFVPPPLDQYEHE